MPGSGEVLTRWDEIKKWEKAGKGWTEAYLPEAFEEVKELIEEEKESIWHMSHPLVISRIVSKCDMRMKNKVKFTLLKALAIKSKKSALAS